MITRRHIIATLATVFLLTPVLAFTATPLTLRVQATSSESHEEIAGSHDSTHTQKKNVKGIIHNMGQEPVENLTVKFFAFGRDQQTCKTVIFNTAEKKLALDGGKEAMTSFEVQTSYAPEHFASSRSGGGSGGRSHTVTKKVPAQGMKLIGYSVQVVQGTAVLAEDFQPRGLKDDFASTPISKPETPKPKSTAPKKAN